MKARALFSGFVLLLGGLLCGCATSKPSLAIPASDSPQRSFAPAPPTVIRMPVKLAFPKVTDLPKDIPQWLDQEVHRVNRLLQTKVKDLGWKLSALRGATDLEKLPKLWDAMQEPIFLEKNIWLLIRPEALSSGVAQADPKNPFLWNLVLEMTAHPQVVFGPEPQVTLRKLPPFGLYKFGPEGFHAVGDTTVSFKEANRILADPKNGLVNYRIKGTGSYRLKVKGVKLYGSQGEVIAQTLIEYYPLINFDGEPSQMTIYFRGHPTFNPHNEIFYLKDLDFDVKTGDLLMQVANWILKSDIRDALRKKARIPVEGKLEQLRQRMNVVLNRPVGQHASLKTDMESFRILEAFVDRDGIRARMSLDGTAQLELLDR
ncbi:MAG TPA: DUF4403 family protein [bacterium]|nr:DUF4403 family protein [bacterium]